MRYIILYRTITCLLIAAMLLLGMIAVLSVWEVIRQEDALWKSITTSCIVALVAVVALASLKFLEEREKAHRP